MPNGLAVPHSLFDFTPEEVQYCTKIGEAGLVDKLVPGWYKQIALKKADAARKEEMERLRQQVPANKK